jgi:serine/threonine protein kinase/Flp pilus assembly protein TadD
MNTNFERLRQIFLAIVDQPSCEWEARLDQACGDDLALRRQVSLLFKEYAEGEGILDRPRADSTATACFETWSEGPGTVIGPYKLMEQIGEGGMGLVFVAEQQHPVRRKVALKVIKPGMDTRWIMARFEAERQALALMDHPNIAKVHDGGETAGGRPYFVMELVKGVPITEYCDDNKLIPRKRLELFLTVCEAVQHAHQKGIIHRDIKPSNVLVTSHDGKPVVKVIDFGVAKPIGQQLTDKTVYTQFAQLIGTPLYMSPEQAGESSLDVDTRSDIYALGVLLYELLTGTTPFDKKRLNQASFDEIRRIIREEEPPKPSTRMSTVSQGATTASEKRGSDPRKLSRLFRGELDWIVMKALEKDRNRRYETASAFAADVRHYLSDEPVQACPPSVSYRLQKFVRRHKGPVSAASAILLVLLVGIVGTTTGLVLALAAERRTATERDEKEEARRQTRQALNTMTDEVVEKLLGKQAQLTDESREFLKKVLAYHEAFAAAKADDPEGRQSRAEAYSRVGSIRMALGEIREAEAAYHDAVAIQQQLADEFPDRPEFRQGLATSHGQLGDALTFLGRTEEAEEAYREALALWTQLAADFPARPEFRQKLARTHMALRDLLRNTSQPEQAEAACLDAQVICTQLAADFPNRPEYREDLADCYYRLGELLNAIDRKKEAESAYGEALAIRNQLAIDFPNRAESHEGLALNHIMLGVMYRATGRPKEAEEAYREAVKVGKQLAAEFPSRLEFRQELALAYQNLCVLLGEAGRFKETEEACLEGLALNRRLAADYPNRAEIRGVLALALQSHGNLLHQTYRLKEAEADYREAVTLWRQVAIERPRQSENRQLLAQSQLRLGKLLSETQRPMEAEASYREAIDVGEKLVGEFPARPELIHDVALTYFHLGDLQIVGDRPKDAEASYRKAFALWNRMAAKLPARPEPRLGMAMSRYNLSVVLRKTGRPEEADSEYRAAFPDIEAEAEAHYDLANELRTSGRVDEAIAEFRAAIRVRKDYPEAHVNLGNLLALKGARDEAIDEFRQALATKRAFPESYNAHYALGSALLEKGRTEEAIAELLKAVRLNNGFALAYYDLGNALYADRLDEAITAYRQAIRVQPDYPQAHVNLGNSLARQGRMGEAISEYREAIATKLNFPEAYKAHQNLGHALQDLGRLDEAIAEFRQAIALKPDDAEAHYQLGLALHQHGEFRMALEGLRRGHELGSKILGWPYPDSAQWVRKCERHVELDSRLPAFLDGKATAGPDEQVELATICSNKGLNRAAARFWEQAFTGKPQLAEDLQAEHRYNAACAAALAGCSQGKDADKLDEKERAQLHRQAVDWLQADLAAWNKELAKNTPQARAAVRNTMLHWQTDSDFAGVRGTEALAKLAEAERQLWEKLWKDVDDLLKRAQEKATPETK